MLIIRSSSASYALIRFSSRLSWLELLAEESRRIGESDMGRITSGSNYALQECSSVTQTMQARLPVTLEKGRG